MVKKNQNIRDNIFKILNGEIEVHYGTSIRQHILKNNIFEYMCQECGINEWKNKKLSLEIDHIDGDKWNNKRENLKLLCPNCHSITHNYRSKKGNKNKKCYTDEQIIEEMEKGGSINQILLNLNLSNSGGNYKRIYKLCKENQILIPKKLSEKPIHYQQITQEKIDLKLKELQEKIDLVTNSGVNFNKRGWMVEVSKILGIVPQAVQQWMVREIPEFYKNCYHQIDNQKIKDL